MWQAALLPTTVILDAAPPECAGLAARDIDAWHSILADRMTTDGRHMVLSDAGGPHHLWLRDISHRSPLAYLVLRDGAFTLRQRAAVRFDRRLSGDTEVRSALAHRPTSFQRRRLDRLLAILDMSNAPAGHTSYDIAQRLIYRDLAVSRGIAWKASGERRQTMRLIDQARRLMRGGYRELLMGIVKG